MSNQIFLQFGCGWVAPRDWVNYDASPTLRFERIPIIGKTFTKNSERFPVNVQYGDITRGLPLPANSCRAIYSSHVLEHMSLNDARIALNEAYRLLAPGGTFRVVVPDLKYFVSKYITSNDVMAAHTLMSDLCMGVSEIPKGILARLSFHFGNSRHLWMWDEKSLLSELQAARFTDVRRAEYSDYSEKAFSSVEREDRWKGGLGFEAYKTN